MKRFALLAVLVATAFAVFFTGLYRSDKPGLQVLAQALAPRPQPPPVREVTICAVGDVMLDRNVGHFIQEHGAASIVGQVATQLRAADVRFANLECPLSNVGPHAPSDCVFRARPETIQVLGLAGINVVSLANNHTLNAGREGILQTLKNLDRAGIRYCGAAADRNGSRPIIVRARDMRVAFLAFTDLSFGHGSYSKVDANRRNVVAAIAAARQQSDLVVVSLHWGEEYRTAPTQRQVNLAHTMVNAGADVILGHHPHVLEGIEVYKNRPILYSMGNFIFDQYDTGGRMESAIFDITFNTQTGWRVAISPVWIPRTRMGPIPAPQSRRDAILKRMLAMSSALGARMTVSETRAYLDIPLHEGPAESSTANAAAPSAG